MRILPPEFNTDIGRKYLLNIYIGIVFFIVGAIILIKTFGFLVFLSVVFAVVGIFEFNKHSLLNLRKEAKLSLKSVESPYGNHPS